MTTFQTTRLPGAPPATALCKELITLTPPAYAHLIPGKLL